MTKPRTKKAIPAMFPQKIWLSQAEAMSYTDMSKPTFIEFAHSHHLTVSVFGRKFFYKVSEINKAFDNNIIIKQVA